MNGRCDFIRAECPRGQRKSTLGRRRDWTSQDEGSRIEGGRTGLGRGLNGPPRSASAESLPSRSVQQQPPHIGAGRKPQHGRCEEDHLMQTFIVEAANRPGELARVADTIARRGINVEAFCLGYGTKGAAAFLASDEKGVRSALDSEGF